MLRIIETTIYWLATAVMAALMLFAIVGYTTQYAAFSQFFVRFGYPTYIVYPLATAKATALLVILLNRWRNLKDIAYGAYFLNMCLATAAHLFAGDNPVHAYAGLVAVPTSYILSNRVRGEPKRDAFLLPKRR